MAPPPSFAYFAPKQAQPPLSSSHTLPAKASRWLPPLCNRPIAARPPHLPNRCPIGSSPHCRLHSITGDFKLHSSATTSSPLRRLSTTIKGVQPSCSLTTTHPHPRIFSSLLLSAIDKFNAATAIFASPTGQLCASIAYFCHRMRIPSTSSSFPSSHNDMPCPRAPSSPSASNHRCPSPSLDIPAASRALGSIITGSPLPPPPPRADVSVPRCPEWP
jgi:hypothetical protein